jgi:hypothetical protein
MLSMRRWRGRDAETLEKRLHVKAQLLVVAVDGGPGAGLAAASGGADAGEDGGDDVLAEDQEGR